MRLALDGGASAEDQFNRQFVAAQLSLLAAPGQDQPALGSKLSCYGINFAPVALSQGATITPNTTLGILRDLARSAASSSSGADLTALANLFAQSHTTQYQAYFHFGVASLYLGEGRIRIIGEIRTAIASSHNALCSSVYALTKWIDVVFFVGYRIASGVCPG